MIFTKITRNVINRLGLKDRYPAPDQSHGSVLPETWRNPRVIDLAAMIPEAVVALDRLLYEDDKEHHAKYGPDGRPLDAFHNCFFLARSELAVTHPWHYRAIFTATFTSALPEDRRRGAGSLNYLLRTDPALAYVAYERLARDPAPEVRATVIDVLIDDTGDYLCNLSDEDFSGTDMTRHLMERVERAYDLAEQGQGIIADPTEPFPPLPPPRPAA